MTHTYDIETYGKPERLRGEHEYADYLEQIGALAEAAGVDLPGLDAARTKVATSRNIVTEFRRHREDPEDAASRVASALVAGEMDLDQAAAELVTVEAMGAESILAKAVKRTAAKIPAAAFSEFARQLDGEAILMAARESAASARQQILKLRGTLADVRNADQANARGSRTASAWAKYTTELLPRWQAAHDLVARLRDLHLIAPLPLTDRSAAKYGRFDIAQSDSRRARRAKQPIRLILDECCDAWAPTGPHTPAEAAKFCDEIANVEAAENARDQKIAEKLMGRPSRSGGKVHVG